MKEEEARNDEERREQKLKMDLNRAQYDLKAFHTKEKNLIDDKLKQEEQMAKSFMNDKIKKEEEIVRADIKEKLEIETE